jgi:hypothetical protein
MSYSISVVFTLTLTLLIRLKCCGSVVSTILQQQTLFLLWNYEFLRNFNRRGLSLNRIVISYTVEYKQVTICTMYSVVQLGPNPFHHSYQSQICILIVKYYEWSSQRCVQTTYINTRNRISIENLTSELMDDCSLQRSHSK